MIIRPLPDVARIVIDGEEIGSMSWSFDDSNLIYVFGEAKAVVLLAHEIAKSLGGRFRSSTDEERR
jgi:hypothetical protein